MHQQQNSRIFTCKPKFDEAMRELITERFGTLLKQENLSCIENELLIKDTCVLESLSPFFGYYDRITTGAKPLYLYLMLEMIITASMRFIWPFSILKEKVAYVWTQ